MSAEETCMENSTAAASLSISNLESKIADHPELFTSCSSIIETLGLFLFRHHLLDAPSTVLENDVRLVGAAFGRIKLFGGAARSETLKPPIFVETFRDRSLSSRSLLTNNSLPDQLTEEVSIVGYDDQQPKPAISHKSNTTQYFMETHVENNFKYGDQDIPPFYFSTSQLRQVVEKALVSVSNHAVQETMEKEQSMQQLQQPRQDSSSIQSDQQSPRLQNFCPTGIYVSMVITYPAEVVNFQVVHPDSKPELEGLQHMSIGIDGRNFPKIFSRRHVKFLDTLKRPKRRSEEKQPEATKKGKASK
ncbi:hypothetical protein BGZ50_007702 [Haplosporangium sp. Z 11]|nr:hypothetical protein BGZ50_007702 [Haplosporangium sp. Z 11]